MKIIAVVRVLNGQKVQSKEKMTMSSRWVSVTSLLAEAHLGPC